MWALGGVLEHRPLVGELGLVFVCVSLAGHRKLKWVPTRVASKRSKEQFGVYFFLSIRRAVPPCGHAVQFLCPVQTAESCLTHALVPMLTVCTTC